ncbi:Dihydrofolate reductase type 3 [Halioglobus japonicus]|nr:Dihydrofolate reductase type 3 [Halioglobus japonicus]
MTRTAIIVAVADNGVIGKDNALPWKLSEDMQHFKRITMGKPVVMGRKTYESIGKPLPGRTNIVVSRNAGFRAEGVALVRSLEEALALAGEVAERDAVEEIIVMGGAQIYAEAIPLADRMYITEVHGDVEGDAVLCEIDWRFWREATRDKRIAQPPNSYDYSFVCYERVSE